MRHLLILSVIAALAPASVSALAVRQQADSVAYVPLRASGSQKDCDTSPPSITICRVRGGADVRLLSAALENGRDVIRNGSELTFIRRAEGKAVELTGGIQYPMSRVVGTDIWVVTTRIADLDHALISYGFFVDSDKLKPGAKLETHEWRGPLAAAPAPKSQKLAGSIRVDSLPSKYANALRSLVSYLPPERGNAPIAGVVYMGDGGAVHGIAAYIDTLIVTGALPRIMLVGIPNGTEKAGDPPGTDVRAMEYLWGYEESNARFIAHEKFVTEEVIPWAERTLGAPRSREQRAVWGISNSGGWAISMALRHPDLIGIVLAFSPGGSHGSMPDDARPSASVRYLLQGGILEPPFVKIARDWRDSLQVRGITSTVRELVAGHDWIAWCEAFPAAIRWAWMRDERNKITSF